MAGGRAYVRAHRSSPAAVKRKANAAARNAWRKSLGAKRIDKPARRLQRATARYVEHLSALYEAVFNPPLHPFLAMLKKAVPSRPT